MYGFNYPYSNYWSIRHFNFSQAARVYVFLTGIPANGSAGCFFSQLEALKENPGRIVNPRIIAGDQKIVFPVELNTEDYLEYSGSGRFHAFDARGFTIAEDEVQGEVPTIAAGAGNITFDCEHADSEAPAAKIEVIALGAPIR